MNLGILLREHHDGLIKLGTREATAIARAECVSRTRAIRRSFREIAPSIDGPGRGGFAPPDDRPAAREVIVGVYAPPPQGLQWNRCRNGGMAEWTNATVLKTVNPHGFVGSNPTPSASSRLDRRLFDQVRLPQSTYLVDPIALI